MAVEHVDSRRTARFSVAAWGIGSLVVTAGVALGVVRYANGSPELERGVEGALSSVALASVVAAPGVLALLSTAGRPILLLPAAVVLFPVSFLSLAGVLLPLLIPALALSVAYGRQTEPGRGLEATGITLMTVTMLLAAVMALFVHQDPRTYTTATSSGSTSDVVTYAESAICIALVVITIVADWWLTRPTAT